MTRTRNLLLASVVFMSINMGGCSDNMNSKAIEQESSSSVLIQDEDVEIVTASSLEKLEQRKIFQDFEKKHEIDISAAANEYESAQIVLCAKRKAINSYNAVVLDDLKCDDNIISKDNITIDSAYYNSISNSQNGFPSGYYPDVLIPLDDRINYGDNRVEQGEIQSLWVTIYVPKGTKEGKYSSKIKIIYDESEKEIPINVNVYGFELPDETHVKSAFDIWGPTHGNDMLSNIYGKKAMLAENNYYEFLLKYRISPTSLPNLDLSSPESFVDQAFEYAARKDVSSFIIPTRRYSTAKYADWFDEKFLHDILSLFVDRSTDEFNIFDKVYFYGIVDEPDYLNIYEKARDLLASLKNIVDSVLEEKEGEGAFINKPLVKKGLEDFYSLMTLSVWGDKLGDLGENTTGFCPKFEVFDHEDWAADIANKKKEGYHFWAYGCNVPGWPYPTYQIDSDLISPRSIGILQMKYDLEGNLFWCANVSRVFDGTDYTTNWDPYETAYAFITWPGDGYVVAPPGKYNEKRTSPYPTLRLSAIRDGQEDYEYIYLLKSLAKEKGEAEFERINNILMEEYNKVFDGSKPTEEIEIMTQFRDKIVELIQELNKD